MLEGLFEQKLPCPNVAEIQNTWIAIQLPLRWLKWHRNHLIETKLHLELDLELHYTPLMTDVLSELSLLAFCS
jgi:hypothetical protein